MTNRVILTDRREKLLSGDYNADDSADRMAKSRLNDSATVALNELTQIADSPHVDHTDIFSPEDVHQFLRALLTATHADHVEAGGLITSPEEEEQADLPTVDYSAEFENYQNELRANLAKLVLEDQYGD